MNDQYSTSFSKQFKEDQDEFLNIAIKKWKFHKNLKRNLILFSLIGCFFLIFAIIFLVYNLKIVEISVFYEDRCYKDLASKNKCNIQITIPQDMEPPIFVYYQLENFYQSNRNYFQSKDNDQLKGKRKNVDELSICAPYITNQQMGKTESLNKTPLIPDDPAFPCGQIAKTYFTDSFEILSSDQQSIDIDQNNIALENDRQNNFINPEGYESFSWSNITDEHFIVWMRTAGQGTIRKLWGRVNTEIPEGEYTLQINNSYNVSSFNGKKMFFMTTTSPFGQKNLVLVGSYFAGAFICFVSIIVMVVIYLKDKKNKII